MESNLRRIAKDIKRLEGDTTIVPTLHSMKWDSVLHLLVFLDMLGIDSVLAAHDSFSYSKFIERMRWI